MKKTEGENDFVYGDLSYQTIGCLFEVWNNVGWGHKESFYQKALARELEEKNIRFKEQLPARVVYKKKPLGIYYFDFLIEDKLILELKVRNYFSKKDIDQAYSYLRAKSLKLAILAHFSKTGVKIKRVVNLK